MMVVTRHSAEHIDLVARDVEHIPMPDSNHRDLTRFDNVQDERYKSVKDKIQQQIARAPETVQKRFQHIARHQSYQGRSRVLSADIVGAEQLATRPQPLFTVPFPRDPDYVERASITDQIHQKLSVAAARVALVGLGGVG
jgi:hypothetical protein